MAKILGITWLPEELPDYSLLKSITLQSIIINGK